MGPAGRLLRMSSLLCEHVCAACYYLTEYVPRCRCFGWLCIVRVPSADVLQSASQQQAYKNYYHTVTTLAHARRRFTLHCLSLEVRDVEQLVC